MKRILLNIFALPLFSRIYGRLTRIKRPRFLAHLVIRKFITHYKIDLNQYQGTPKDYPSLADFFVRPLDPKSRPLNPDPPHIVSPCDGFVADLQLINSDKAVQAKGKTYPISGLIGSKLDWSRNWWLCTLYLSPANYHRFHYPWSGQLERIQQLGNRLFPVNQHGVNAIPGLFIRNERLVLSFDINGSPAFATAVGATFVGSISLCPLDNKPLTRGSVPVNKKVEQLQEMGRFNLGSTIILLFPKDLAEPLILADVPVITGQPLFRLRP